MKPALAAMSLMAAVLGVKNSAVLNADLMVVTPPVTENFPDSHPPKFATVALVMPEVVVEEKLALTLELSLATVLIWSFTLPEVKMP